ncbi:MAG: hypothetical protein R3F56_20955 [Planctomycetota bacterium]
MATRTVASILSPLLLATLAPAQADLAAAFPAGSWAFVDLTGIDEQAATFHQARLVGLAQQILGDVGTKNLQALGAQRGQRELEKAQQALARLGISATEVRGLLDGGLALGVGRPVFMGENMLPSLALVALARDDAAARPFSPLIDRLAQNAPNAVRSTQVIGGVEFARLDLPRHGQVLYGTRGRYCLIGNSPGYLAECLACLQNQTPSLAKDACLEQGRGLLRGKRMASLLVNARPFAQALAPLLPYEAATLGQALGITGAPELFVGLAHDGKNACDLLDLTLPGPTDGLLKTLLSKPVSNHAARWVKRNTALFASFAFDVDAAKEAFARTLHALPPGAEHELRRELGREFRGKRLQLLEDVLGALGGEISIALDLPQPLPPFVTFTVFAKVRDMDKAEGLLRQVASDAHLGEVRYEEIDGAKVWSTDVRMRDMRISPTVALHDGWLVASNFSNVVKRHLRSGELGDDALASDPRFVAATKVAPHAGIFLTARFQAAVDAYWGLASTGIRAGANRLGFEPDEIPDAEAVCAAIDDVVLAATATERGFTVRVQQPLGLGTLLPAGAAALDWLLSQLGGRKVYRIY